ncbi:MarR family transcriptional regulator [Chitinimonas sp.]|uniref:MarR family winged helix-turn-helix transcriptional regulator n=1 Tax=Chitinimonas sp. TaxID=1934313 RepID=UPI002F925D3E
MPKPLTPQTDKVDAILAQWQRERPDLDPSPMGLIGRMGRLSRYLQEEVESALTPLGLSNWSFDVLATLRRSGKPYTLSPTSLMTTMMITSGTMTNRIDQLEKRGWVARQANPDDRRGFLIQLTAEGLACIDHAVTVHVANEHRIVAALSEEERGLLAGLLRHWLLAAEHERGAP